mmetsp:Transcript_20947/g.28494  ORF Transcript_20947/g.28494 Transcript_20947/m.28494 type:complete len:136 (-) Transcript_20947:603-1010(-)
MNHLPICLSSTNVDRKSPLRFDIDRERLGFELSEPVSRILSLRNGSSKEIRQARIKKAIEAFMDRPGDTGSTPVQVAVITVKIEALRDHVSTHRKDNVTKRRLALLTNQRRALLKYLERKDYDMYRTTVKSLDLV